MNELDQLKCIQPCQPHGTVKWPSLSEPTRLQLNFWIIFNTLLQTATQPTIVWPNMKTENYVLWRGRKSCVTSEETFFGRKSLNWNWVFIGFPTDVVLCTNNGKVLMNFHENFTMVSLRCAFGVNFRPQLCNFSIILLMHVFLCGLLSQNISFAAAFSHLISADGDGDKVIAN